MNRETWLRNALIPLSELFKRHGHSIPECYVSVSWPSSKVRKAIGECFSSKLVADEKHAIFISPILADGLRVLDVLIHELIHATVGVHHGHKGPFTKLAKSLGLQGKMTATVASDALKLELQAIIDQHLGPYPHSAVGLSNRKKQGTRLLKVQCLDCGYNCRITQKWIDLSGPPICPCNDMTMSLEGEDDL